MRLIIKLLVCLCFIPVSTFSQERIRKVMVGPRDDQVRIVIAFVEASPEAYSMQSMIVDVDSVKNKKEQPSSFQVDLTSTVRSLSTGEKRQKILVLRWKKTGEIELKCDGKWVRRNDLGSVMDKIVEATKAVARDVPLDAKSPTEVTLSQEVEQKVSSILNALNTEDFPCLRNAQ
jgi:hypothetical protein